MSKNNRDRNMTQEEKQLLLKDLCGRLPYGVKGLHREQVHELFTIDGREVNNGCIQVDGYDAWFSVDTFKPYLRPMSSMTEEEVKTFKQLQKDADEAGTFEGDMLLYDWLNKNHFDYRLLIFQGLALEAPEGMYKNE